MGFTLQPLIEFARAKITIETLKKADGYSVNELLLVFLISRVVFVYFSAAAILLSLRFR